MRGKTVFITGAARGIGAAAAERMHAAARTSRSSGSSRSACERERRAPRRARGVVRGGRHRHGCARSGGRRRPSSASAAIDVAIANAGIAFTGTLRRPRSSRSSARSPSTCSACGAPTARCSASCAAAAATCSTSRRCRRSHARADDGSLHLRQGGRRGAHRRAAHGDRAARRGRRLRVLRLPRHRPRESELRAALDRSDAAADAGLHAQSGAAGEGDRRDRARHRAPLGAGVGAALGRPADLPARHRCSRSSNGRRCATWTRCARTCASPRPRGEAETMHPVLGVAANALPDTPRSRGPRTTGRRQECGLLGAAELRRSRSPSMTRPSSAITAASTPGGTCQPHQVTPGSSVRRAAAVMCRWAKTIAAHRVDGVGERVEAVEDRPATRQAGDREHRAGEEEHRHDHHLHQRHERLHLRDPRGDHHAEGGDREGEQQLEREHLEDQRRRVGDADERRARQSTITPWKPATVAPPRHLPSTSELRRPARPSSRAGSRTRGPTRSRRPRTWR